MSNNSGIYNSFGSFINNITTNRIDIVDHIEAYNVVTSATNINNNTWRHIVLMIDRSKDRDRQNSIYVDGVLSYAQTQRADLNGKWTLNPLFIGQRGGSSYGLNGKLKFLKIFNYPLSTTEITNLYNKTR